MEARTWLYLRKGDTKAYYHLRVDYVTLGYEKMA